MTCTFTAGSKAFDVPTGLSSLHIVAVGGAGGAGSDHGGTGGEGDQVTGDLSVRGGSTLYVQVGGNGGAGTGQSNCINAGTVAPAASTAGPPG
jgi:hypothetical protein